MIPRRRVSSRAVLVFVACSMFLGAACAAEPAPASPAVKPARDLPAIPADLLDPAFAGQVDLVAIRQAIGALDAGTLIAEAEKLVRAERSLGKPHRALSAAALLEVALRVVSEQHDQEAFGRLQRTLADLGIKEFDEKLVAIRALLANPRRVSAGPNVPLRAVSIEAIVLYNTLVEQVKVAKVVGDRDGLGRLRRTIQELDELHAKQRQHLVLLIDDAVASLPNQAPAETLALARLAAPLYGSPPASSP